MDNQWGRLNTETCFLGIVETCFWSMKGSLQLLAVVDILGGIFE